MSKTSSIDVPPLDMTTNTPRSKKIAPPPLRLPETVTNHQNEDKNNSIEQQKQEKFIENHSCSALSTDDCPHKPIPLVKISIFDDFLIFDVFHRFCPSINELKFSSF